jgi:hypothetical protein
MQQSPRGVSSFRFASNKRNLYLDPNGATIYGEGLQVHGYSHIRQKKGAELLFANGIMTHHTSPAKGATTFLQVDYVAYPKPLVTGHASFGGSTAIELNCSRLNLI